MLTVRHPRRDDVVAMRASAEQTSIVDVRLACVSDCSDTSGDGALKFPGCMPIHPSEYVRPRFAVYRTWRSEG